MNLNAFLAIGVIGLVATFLTELISSLLGNAFGQHTLGAWLPYYAVWLVFTVVGVATGKHVEAQKND